VVAIGCYDTNRLGVPNEDADGVIDGLEYLKIATLGRTYPGHAGTRVVVIGGGFTAMDCSRTSVRQHASEVTLVYRRDMKDMPAASEVHEAMEEGVTAIFQAGPTRVLVDEATGKVTGVEFIRMQLGAPDASGRRRPEPAPARSFTIECDRVLLAIGQGPDLAWIGPATRGRRPPSSAPAGRPGDVRDRPPGVFGTGDVRIGAATVVQAIAEGRRAAYAVDAYLQGLDLGAIRTRQTLAEPQPQFLSIVPFTSEVKESRHRLASMPAEERRASYVEYEIPYSREDAVAESRAACSARARRSASAISGASASSTRRRSRRWSRRTTGGRVPQRHREPLHRLQPRLHPGRQPRLHPPRAVALHRLRPLRPGLFGGRRGGVLRLHAGRLRHAGHDAARHEPQRHAVRLLRPLRRDLPHRRPDAQAAPPREVRGRREPLHPLWDLRRRLPLRRAPLRPRLRAGPHQPRGADDRPLAIAAVDRETEMSYVRRERDWAERARASGRDIGPRMLPVLPASLAAARGRERPRGRPSHGNNGHGTAGDAGGHAPHD